MTPLNAITQNLLDEPVTTPEQPLTRARGRASFGLLGTWWQVVLVLLLVVFGPTAMASSPYLNTFTLAGIWGIALVGVSMLASLGGQFTFGHAGLVSVGAYSSAIVTVEYGGAPALGVLVGVVIAAAVALVTAPILRLRGWYLALATLAMAYLFQELAVNLKPLTRGNDGILGIQPLEVLGFRVEETATFFIVSWSLVLVLMVGARNLSASRFGSAARAIQVDEDTAVSLAVPALRYKATVWVMAAVMAAVSGSLYAHYARFVSPQDFSIHQSIILFMAVLLGGYRSTFGALVALVFLLSLPQLGRDFAPTTLLTALALMVVYLISSEGLAGIGTTVSRVSLAAVRTLVRRARHA